MQCVYQRVFPALPSDEVRGLEDIVWVSYRVHALGKQTNVGMMQQLVEHPLDRSDAGVSLPLLFLLPFSFLPFFLPSLPHVLET